jgi:hypothetical protein
MHIPLASIPTLLLTWHSPVVTGIVHLGPRLSANCSPLFPIVPLCPPLQNPNPSSDFPEPNVHLIKARLNPLPSIPNNSYLRLRLGPKGSLSGKPSASIIENHYFSRN